MSKQTEALKLALEALERMKHYGNTFAYRNHEQNPYEQVCEAIAAIEALAEQPAQQQECRDNWKDRLIAQHEETILWQAKRIGELTDQTAQPQQEPVAFDVVCHDCGGDGFDRQDSNYRCALCNGCGFIEKMLYTSPPSLSLAQRQRSVKPLTNEEIENVWGRVQANDFHECVQPFARAIEAAHGIKEKNSD
jgi:hypothetical protein